MDLINTLPDIDINRNETELLIFSEYFKKIDQNCVKNEICNVSNMMKNIEISNKSRQDGNTYYKLKIYAEALSLYHHSIAFAPRTSTEYGLSIASRSAVLFDLKKYKECLVDIDRIFRSEFPKNMLYKIYMRQARCYIELQCYKEACEATDNAKQSFECVKETLEEKKKVDVVDKIRDIESLLEDRRNKEKLVDDDDSSLPELTHGENSSFTYASNAVALRMNEVRGKHVIAAADIKKGDVLFVEEPYSSAMYTVPNQYPTYCNRCFVSSLTCIPCTSCTVVVFCSDHCRQLAWNSRHRWECAGIRRGIISEESSLVLGILFRSSHAGLNTTLLARNVYGNKLDNYPYVNQMMTHKFNIPDKLYNNYLKTAAFLLVYLMHFTDYFDWFYARYNRPHGSRDDLCLIVGGLLLKTICQIYTNKEIVEDQFVEFQSRFDIKLQSIKLTYALYVSSNTLNHSCLPNAMKSFHGSTKIVRALADIERGTEITVCYVTNVNLEYHKLRHWVLGREYYFKCTCEHCVDPYKLFPWLCGKCDGPAFTSSDHITAKCQQCNYHFPLYAYKKMDVTSKQNHMKYDVTRNYKYLKKTINIQKQIYHGTNWKLSVIYNVFAMYYERRGDFKQCLKYLKLFTDLHRVVHASAASRDNVAILLKYCLMCANYYIRVKDQEPQMYNMTLEAITDALEPLEYYMPKKYIDNYQQRMIQFLDTSDPISVTTSIRCHPNVID